jgi:nitronate monooxygenase
LFTVGWKKLIMSIKNKRSIEFTKQLGIQVPIICGPMYPCSNPELVAAASNAGAIGIVQPVSLTYVFGYDFREGIRYIKQLTSQPIGMNALIEQSSHRYHQRMIEWLEIALEEGVRFFITSLGKPNWVVDLVHAHGGVVFHDVTERKWAEKGVESGVDGLICVNNRAGGHSGTRSAQALFDELSDLQLPLICAGGIATPVEYQQAQMIGYAGVQMGTRFIASAECQVSAAYKQAIVEAEEHDIVLSERVTGVPVALINTSQLQQRGLSSGRFAQWLLKGKKTKHWMRIFYALRSLWQLKIASLDTRGKAQYWQAGKSVSGIRSVKTVAEIIKQFNQQTE